jgi:hypothetical protein
MRSKHIRRLQSPALLRTKNAWNHQTLFEAEYFAGIAKPVTLRKCIDTVAALVHWDIAIPTENNQIFVFVIPAVAN